MELQLLFEIDKIIPFDNTDGVYGIEGINVDLSVIQVKPKDGKNLSDSFGSFEIAALEEIQKLKLEIQLNMLDILCLNNQIYFMMLQL